MGLYNFILHRKWPAWPFLLGLQLRELLFWFRNALGGYIYHPKPLPKDMKFDCILLIRGDRIGDIILTLPAFNALRKAYPKAKIDWYIQEKYSDIFKRITGWNMLIFEGCPKPKNKVYDLAIVFHPAKYAYKLAQKHAKYSIGWDCKGFGYTLSKALKNDRTGRHQVLNNLKLLELIGIDPAPPSHIPGLKVEPYGFAYPRKKILAIHPGSFSPRVRWPAKNYAKLADLASKKYRIYVLGSKNEWSIIREMEKYSKAQLNYAIDGSLSTMIDFLAAMDAFVGNSSGPMHIANAVGIKTIGIFGNDYPMDSYRLWRPWGPNSITIHADNCCKMPWTCKKMECMESITPERVWRHLK